MSLFVDIKLSAEILVKISWKSLLEMGKREDFASSGRVLFILATEFIGSIKNLRSEIRTTSLKVDYLR